ncbi:hypothetical protein ACIRLA_22230 [Streptomyces sp. NPDC102364]|uniref:hypothetical protein n=1 Tax=Streptomyces sp. NPDC102364 TaxID=3366161 RepID=UPI003806E9B6
MTELSPEQIAELRKDPDSFRDYLRHITGRAVEAPAPAVEEKPAEPAYENAHRGGWPIGTAASGPTPTHGRCSCIQCEQAAVVQLPTVQHRNAEGEAA